MQAESVVTAKRSELYWKFSNTFVLIKRSLMHIIKSPDQLLSVAIQPIMFTLLFRYVFGGAIETGGTTYVNFLMAGILIQTAGFGATYTALNLAVDLKEGIVDRFRSLPMSSSALLIGHVTSDLVRNVLSGAVMVAVGLLIGFRPVANFNEWLYVVALILAFTFAFSWLSAIMGLLAKSVEAVQWMTFVFIFPLTFASSAFVPTDGMPKYLRLFADNQPVTHVIEATRAWLVGTPIGNHGWLAFIWCFGIILVAIPITVHLYKNRSR